jgi:hypothetical protein
MDKILKAERRHRGGKECATQPAQIFHNVLGQSVSEFLP